LGMWKCESGRVYEQAGRWIVGVRAVWRPWQWTVMAPGTGWEHGRNMRGGECAGGHDSLLEEAGVV